MFNSPLHYCTLCRRYVELDQSHAECAREHGCATDACPLRAYFCGDPLSNPTAGAAQEPSRSGAPTPDLD